MRKGAVKDRGEDRPSRSDILEFAQDNDREMRIVLNLF